MNILVRLTYVLVLIYPFSPRQRLHVSNGKPLFFAQWSTKFELWHRGLQLRLVNVIIFVFRDQFDNEVCLGR